MGLKQRIAKYMFEHFNTLNWGCPDCGKKVIRIYPHKAECQGCKKVYDVDKFP
jgi:hypothetical protein